MVNHPNRRRKAAKAAAPEVASAAPTLDAADAARYRWLWQNYDQFTPRIGHAQPGRPNAFLWMRAGSNAEFDQAVDEQMAGQQPVVIRIA